MTRFYASIQGNRGEATRMGNVTSGIQGHVRGWNLGARVNMHVNGDDEDVCTVYITRGSNGGGFSKCVWSGTRADFDALIGERVK